MSTVTNISATPDPWELNGAVEITLYERLRALLDAEGEPPEDLDSTLTEGFAHALALDSERRKIERRITELAVNAEDPEAANELRHLWLRHRTLVAELQELRSLLGHVRLKSV